jgi:maleamate amidohydrolase
MKDWQKLIPPAELEAYQRSGFHGDLSMGERAALIVVDVTFGFAGSRGLTLEEAVAEFSAACGPSSWIAMPKIARLIEVFRARALPIVYSRSRLDDIAWTGKATKAKRAARPLPARFNEFPEEIAPREGEWVLEKTKASTFFGTPLSTYLIKERVDTLVFAGVSTSGCVRASVVDGFSHGFSTFVVDDCCFDRSEFAHAANLFDMSGKYASVVSLAELEKVLPSVRQAAE